VEARRFGAENADPVDGVMVSGLDQYPAESSTFIGVRGQNPLREAMDYAIFAPMGFSIVFVHLEIYSRLLKNKSMGWTLLLETPCPRGRMRTLFSNWEGHLRPLGRNLGLRRCTFTVMDRPNTQCDIKCPDVFRTAGPHF
jgi:hypothetical protein